MINDFMDIQRVKSKTKIQFSFFSVKMCVIIRVDSWSNNEDVRVERNRSKTKTKREREREREREEEDEEEETSTSLKRKEKQIVTIKQHKTR